MGVASIVDVPTDQWDWECDCSSSNWSSCTSNDGLQLGSETSSPPTLEPLLRQLGSDTSSPPTLARTVARRAARDRLARLPRRHWPTSSASIIAAATEAEPSSAATVNRVLAAFRRDGRFNAGTSCLSSSASAIRTRGPARSREDTSGHALLSRSTVDMSSAARTSRARVSASPSRPASSRNSRRAMVVTSACNTLCVQWRKTTPTVDADYVSRSEKSEQHLRRRAAPRSRGAYACLCLCRVRTNLLGLLF